MKLAGMSSWRSMAVCAVLWFSWAEVPEGTARSAAAELSCVVCQSRISGDFYWIESPALPAKQSVCKACNQLEARCSLCRLPVNHQGRQLADGRFLCPTDFRLAILDEREALRIYAQARRDVQGILGGAGVLPGANIRVAVVDGNRLRELQQTLPTAHDDTALQGLTRTRVRNKTEFEHDIYLINGLSPARLAAVAAHEYTHAWIHENVPPTRRLERDTVEGFCELVAYKLMAERGEEVEKKVILANAYTRGQVNAFVQAESAQQFHRVVKWMQTGVDETLSTTNHSRVLAIRAAPAEPLWPPPRPVATPVPGQLELRGLSGPVNRRLALINDGTLGAGERGRIRVGSTNVVVHCVEVRANSVLVQVGSEPRPVELFLRTVPTRLAGDPGRVAGSK